MDYSSTLFIIMLLRSLVFIGYLNLIKDGRVITKTATRLAVPFVSILVTFWLLTFEFMVVG